MSAKRKLEAAPTSLSVSTACGNLTPALELAAEPEPPSKRVRSTHELPVHHVLGVLMEWNRDPKTIMASTHFYALLDVRTEKAWVEALAFVDRVGLHVIDSSRGYAHVNDRPNKIVLPVESTDYDSDDDKTAPDCFTRPLFLWCRCEHKNSELIRRVFELLMATGARAGINTAWTDDDETPIQTVLKDGTVEHMNCLLREPTIDTNSFDAYGPSPVYLALEFESWNRCKRFVSETKDAPSIASQLIQRVSGPKSYAILNENAFEDSTPLKLAVTRGYAHELRDLLLHLPVLELDLWVQNPVDDRLLPIQYGRAGKWMRAFELKITATASEETKSAITSMIAVAYRVMAVYRHNRCVLLRELLGDILPYDLFPIIDSFGAALPRP